MFTNSFVIRYIRSLSCVAVPALTLVPQICSAQTPSTIELDTVEVVQSHITKSIKSTAPAFKLSEKEFNRLGVTDISDAIHRLPGVNLRDYGGLGGLKTVSVRGLGSQHTAVVYDGIVLSDCQSGEVDVARYSLDNVESLSMVIGDNDDIFMPARVAASAASFSISSFRQPDPTKPLDLTTQVKYGSFGYINPYLRVGKAFSDKFSMNLIGDYTYAENDYPFRLKNGQHTVTERRNNSRMNSGHGELNAIWSPDSRSNLSAKLYYYDNDRQIPGRPFITATRTTRLCATATFSDSSNTATLSLHSGRCNSTESSTGHRRFITTRTGNIPVES